MPARVLPVSTVFSTSTVPPSASMPTAPSINRSAHGHRAQLVARRPMPPAVVNTVILLTLSRAAPSPNCKSKRPAKTP